MVLSDESVSGEAPIQSSSTPVTEYEENITVPAGEIWYVEGVSYDQNGSDNSGPGNVELGITSAPNGFTDIESEEISRAGRQVAEGSPGQSGVVSLGAYAYGGDTIGLSFATDEFSAPYYRVSIRRVV